MISLFFSYISTKWLTVSGFVNFYHLLRFLFFNFFSKYVSILPYILNIQMYLWMHVNIVYLYLLLFVEEKMRILRCYMTMSCWLCWWCCCCWFRFSLWSYCSSCSFSTIARVDSYYLLTLICIYFYVWIHLCMVVLFLVAFETCCFNMNVPETIHIKTIKNIICWGTIHS